MKVTALYSQFDAIDPEGTIRGVAGRLRDIFRCAQEHGTLINVDMEQYATKDVTLAIFRSILDEPEFRDWPNVGIALQAYLPETEADLVDLFDWVQRRGTPVWIRLVKGAYWDYETVIARQRHWPVPVFTQKWQSDACFERCTHFLFEHYQWLRPAIASHNLRSMARALALAEQLHVPRGAHELQMLYGMGDELKRVFVNRGERLRIYTPFGELLPGMAYLVRRLLENTSNTSFLRATFTEHTTADRLLTAPADVGRDYQEVEMQADGKLYENLAPFVNEPACDFSRTVHRENMTRALAEVKSLLGASYDLWIGGRSVATSDRIDSPNPADFESIVGSVAKASVAQADDAVAAARAAYPAWCATSVWRRAEVLFEVARILRRRRHEFAAWEVFECGKQWREADADVCEAIDFCEYYARAMLELAAPRTRDVPGEDNMYFYTPRGVAVVISPWNFPLAILCGMTVAPLVAGNTVVVKPAEQSSVVAAKFMEIFRDLDLPDGVANFLPGIGEEVGQRLVEHPDVSVITFTGSVAVGLGITRQAAQTSTGQRQVKRVVAEMGGKNAVIVDDDADLDETIKGVIASAFHYSGQKCSACSRVIVLPKVYNAFVPRLKEAISCLAIGPPTDPAYAIGPVIDREAFDRLHEALKRAHAEATCLYAGDPGSLTTTGFYIGPHLFADVKPDSFLRTNELFGPVLAILRAADLDEALAIANATSYALTGGIFSRNPVSIERAKVEFHVGNLYINRSITGALVDLQPFGGFKLSGVGAKAGGPDYLRQFLNPRTITENTLRRGFAPEE